MAAIQEYDALGNARGALTIEIPLQRKEANPVAYAQVVRALLQNWRQGTVACKTRGQVAFSGKKPWKQKGTGRARAGTISSPLWRKGGVIFGPMPRTRTLKVTKKQRKNTCNNIFFAYHDANKIHCLDFDISTDGPSTKKAFQALKGMGFARQKTVIFISLADEVNYTSLRNIKNVQLLSFDQPNAYDITHGDNWVFLKKDVELFKQMVAQWN